MDEIKVDKMTPGILVTELVSLKGGIYYDRQYDADYFDDKAHIREWRTISRIEDPEEREEAQKLRAKIYTTVRSKCVKTPVGLICEESKKDELREALRNVAKERDTFNDRAKTCRLETHHACFEVKEDNHDAIAAIMDQVAGVAESVNKAIVQDDETTLKNSARKWLKGMNPDAILLLPDAEKNAIVARARAELIRKAIRDIRGVERLLPKQATDVAEAMVKESRSIAREICKRVERHNEALDEVLDEVDLTGIRKTRAAFIMGAARAQKKALEDHEMSSLTDPRKVVIGATAS